MSDIVFLPATRQAEMIRSKELSPVELVDAYLTRIEQHDATYNSFVTVVGDAARDQAKLAEAAVARGGDLPPFHGVPISIKDLAETAGIRTTFSCRALAEYVPDQDDNFVRRIKNAGFIILGKSNTSEFGTVPVTESLLNGACRNPWNPELTPGGSSGGAAANIAAGFVAVAQGSDGAGSIRIPASCCGLFGLKPSRGRISAGPRVGEHWHGFSNLGPVARYVEDSAALLDVMQGYETGDPYWAPPPSRPFVEETRVDPPGLRIAFTLTNPNDTPPDPEVVVAVEQAAKLLESLGHDVEPADPPWVDPAVAPTFIQLVQTGVGGVLDWLPHDQMEPLNRFLVESAARISSIQHIQALTAMHQHARTLVGFWDDYDMVLTPTLALPPVPIGWIFEDEDPFMQLVRSGLFIPYTPIANVTGQPAMSVPLHWSPDDIPIGVQFIGRPGAEAELYRLAGQLERAQPWADRRPQVGAAT